MNTVVHNKRLSFIWSISTIPHNGKNEMFTYQEIDNQLH